MDFLANAIVAVIPSWIKPIWRNVTYPFNAEENVKALDKATETLVAMEADVKAEVESSQLQGLRQTNLVGDWFKHVEDVKIEAKEINNRCEERSPLLGKRSLNFWSNYWISKNAAKKLKVVQGLCDQKSKFEKVASQPPPQVQEIPIESDIVPKEQADLQTIIRYIDNDHDTVIGIWGMGGVGKTRLLQLVHNQYAQSSSFDTVIFVTASKECSVEKLQAELCKKHNLMGLGLLQTFDGRNIYNSGYTLIGKLLSACLIESDDPYSVKMHDVIRDMAIWLVCDLGKQRDKWIAQTHGGVNQVLHEKNRWCDTECATLLWPDRDMGELKSIPREAKKLRFLKVHHSLETLVDNLKFFSALTFLDLSYCKLKAFPPAVLHLVNLKYLNLSHNQINHVPEELKHLENLMYLYLRYNDILSFPKGIISQLRELRILSLSGCESKQEYHTWLIEELGCLNNIKSIEIRLQHPDHLESLLKLPFLPIRTLEIEYFGEMDSLVIPSCFFANRAIRDNLRCVYIQGQSVQKVVIESFSQKSPCHLRNLELLDFVYMHKLEMIIWSGVKPKDLFVKLQSIAIFKCDKLNDASWLVHLPCLQYLQIGYCYSMIQIFQRSNFASTSERREVETPTFPSLKNWLLHDLPNLQVICDPSIKFHSLEKLTVLRCPMLKNLPFQPDTIPCNLSSIEGSIEWWEQLEWEQNEHKTALQPFFKKF